MKPAMSPADTAAEIARLSRKIKIAHLERKIRDAAAGKPAPEPKRWICD